MYKNGIIKSIQIFLLFINLLVIISYLIQNTPSKLGIIYYIYLTKQIFFGQKNIVELRRVEKVDAL